MQSGWWCRRGARSQQVVELGWDGVEGGEAYGGHGGDPGLRRGPGAGAVVQAWLASEAWATAISTGRWALAVQTMVTTGVE
jgi:hypothetical protein